MRSKQLSPLLKYGRRWGKEGFRGGELEKEENIGGGLEMASKGLAVTMELLSLVTVGTDLSQCWGGDAFL